MLEIVRANNINVDDVASVIFTVTKDLDAVFPAEAAREIGWIDTPLLCANEIPVVGSLAKCIRVLISINSEKTQKEINHVYLKEAVNLRR